MSDGDLLHFHEEHLVNAHADDECPDSGGDYAATLNGHGDGSELLFHHYAGDEHCGYGRVRVPVARVSVCARAIS
ncbi:MAG: hypothetical protein AB7G75_09610 [Candidatus Binatia bacterium]